ncbi:hypothetical protein ASZ90_019979 [hydrocarbon metagenome]|uniref:Uncharacterized protein n=1 Tax=hydrocarbon metagenome TaxID=938273 RepID=A0A0W8E2R6_9ZZZZ
MYPELVNHKSFFTALVKLQFFEYAALVYNGVVICSIIPYNIENNG